MLPIAASPALAFVALMLAGAMGFAIQRGGTCMVAAMSEIVHERRAGRLIALAECSLWVSALFALLGLVGYSLPPGPGYAAGWACIGGGLLMGLGAWINGACVIGAVARLGSGDAHYLLTPVGFWSGCLAHAAWSMAMQGSAPPRGATMTLFVLAVFSAVLILRARSAVRGLAVSAPERSPLWNHASATVAIGIAFVGLMVLAGPWTYTDALSRAAHGRGLPPVWDAVLYAALLSGALAGGWRHLDLAPPSASRAAACLCGGALLGLGSSVVPGGNDNLILVGLPSLQPHAWLAFGAMVAGIALGLSGAQIVSRRHRRLAGPTV